MCKEYEHPFNYLIPRNFNFVGVYEKSITHGLLIVIGAKTLLPMTFYPTDQNDIYL
jgi:hypothetical protein